MVYVIFITKGRVEEYIIIIRYFCWQFIQCELTRFEVLKTIVYQFIGTLILENLLTFGTYKTDQI